MAWEFLGWWRMRSSAWRRSWTWPSATICHGGAGGTSLGRSRVAGNGPFPAGSGERPVVARTSSYWGRGVVMRGERSGGDLAPRDPPGADQEREHHPDGERGAGVRPLGGAHDLRGHLADGARVVHPRGDAGEHGQRDRRHPRRRQREAEDDGGRGGEQD